MNTITNLSARMMSEKASHMETITDNLANSSTPGFRRSMFVQKKFDAFLNDAVTSGRGASIGAMQENMVSVVPDLTPGGIKSTGRSLDFAINGDGFFAVEKNGREYLTRNGGFTLSADGALTTTGGMTVKSTSGNIVMPANADISQIGVKDDGSIFIGKDSLGKLKLVSVADASRLEPAGVGLFTVSEQVASSEPENPKVSNKCLETSNVSVFEEMSELIGCMRNYESCQKMVKLQDAAEGQFVKQL